MSFAKQAFDRAIVVGSGIAGLLSARVLAEHFERVTVLEQDVPPEGAGPRKGAPQGRHVHGLLPAGLLVLEQLFPGLTQELESQGARRIDLARDTARYVRD